MSSLTNAPITVLHGIGPARAKIYGRLGIFTVSDLAYHFPRAYEDRGGVKPLSECEIGEKASVILTVGTVPRKTMIRRGMTLLKFTAYDESGVCEITFFNQNYLADKFPLGASFRFYGRMESIGRRYKLSSPSYERVFEDKTLPPLIPIYPLTEGLTQSRVAADVRLALSALGAELEDHLPEEIRKKYGLCTLAYALSEIHDPTDARSVAIARRRLVFDELFTFALGTAMSREKRREHGAPPCRVDSIAPVLERLPYSLTGDQLRAVEDIRRDMASEAPMSRMVVGDVGCGKTAVALCAMYVALASGRQAVLMAPTEILARQHFASIAPIFEKMGYRVGLLVGSMTPSAKRKMHESLAASDPDFRVDVVIGTHALISDGVEFAAPGIMITDEQHRFGVAQRATLSKKGESAHFLVMSATPIPRSLALMMYGDLDLSRICEMPAGRQRVDTFVVDESYRARLNGFIRKQVAEGGQVYVVCPSIEEREEAEAGEILLSEVGVAENTRPPLKAAVQFAEELSEALPELRIAYLHGKLRGEEKDAIMRRFAEGEIDVLVSTTVIEVGVNVPRATLMIVENAERFGLAQLHQLRGRVGRGTQKSYCVLVSEGKSASERARLDVMRREYDGFRIAEQDLALRGPGDFIKGSADPTVRQSGGLNFKLANVAEDAEIFSDAFEAARELVSNTSGLSDNENLRGMITRMFSIDSHSLN